MRKRMRAGFKLLLLGAAGMLLGACGGGSSEESSTADNGSGGGNATLPVISTVTGWASQGSVTTGGAAAPASNIYKASNRLELLNALANTNSPTYATNQSAARNEPKIIHIVGSIYGTDLGNGKFADEAWYKTLSSTAANWDWDLYIQSLDTAWSAALAAKVAEGDATAIATQARVTALSSARTALSNLQKAQIQFVIPSNTTLLGVGTNAKIVDGYFSINADSNIIVRNVEFEAPIDLTSSYDNSQQEWNARYKAMSIVTGKQVWIDHCTFSDGARLDTESLTINGVTKIVQRHDGLLDIEDSSDYITVSYSVFKNHDKTNMVGGSGDGNGYKEREYNRITFSHNRWENSTQRAPRARFGQIHVFNNHYTGDTDASPYPMSYYIGMGAESRILSGSNAFDLTGSKADVSRVISNLNGYQFQDQGSWYNGSAASAELEAAAKAALEARWASAQSAAGKSGFTLGAYTRELGWTPPYAYTPAPSAAVLRAHLATHAGAGKLTVDLPSGSGTAASSSSASSAASVCPSDWIASEAGTPGASTLPGAWVMQLTGDLPASAGVSYADGNYTLTSAGGLAGAGDGLTMAYTTVSGDFTLTAKLSAMSVPTSLNAANVVAGLMLRNGNNPRDAYYSVMLRGNRNLRANYRSTNCISAANANITTLSALPSESAPVWMKLERKGQILSASYSSDGTVWTSGHSYDFTATPLASSVRVGLAGASGAATTTTTAAFGNVSLERATSGSSSGAASLR